MERAAVPDAQVILTPHSPAANSSGRCVRYVVYTQHEMQTASSRHSARTVVIATQLQRSLPVAKSIGELVVQEENRGTTLRSEMNPQLLWGSTGKEGIRWYKEGFKHKHQKRRMMLPLKAGEMKF